MIAAIARDHPVAAVIYEHQPRLAIWRTLRFRAKRLGLWTVLGQLALVAYDRVVLRGRSRPAIAMALGPFGTMPEDVPIHSVRSVNSPEAVELLRHYQPEVCVVTGTSIIRERTLGAAPIFLNIHCGLTPAYRGVHGGFWAIEQGDFRHVGVTVHVVDSGIDTGGIVHQGDVMFDRAFETHRTLVAKQYAVGIPLMSRAVGEVLASRLQVRHHPTDVPSKQWFSPTLWDFVRFWRRLRDVSSN